MVDIEKFKSYDLTNKWLDKWFNQMTYNFT